MNIDLLKVKKNITNILYILSECGKTGRLFPCALMKKAALGSSTDGFFVNRKKKKSLLPRISSAYLINIWSHSMPWYINMSSYQKYCESYDPLIEIILVWNTFADFRKYKEKTITRQNMS